MAADRAPDPVLGWVVGIGCVLAMVLPSVGLLALLLAVAGYVSALAAS